MKKFLALILALCMVFALAACGQAAAPAAAAPAEEAAPAAEALVADDIEDSMTSADGKYEVAFVTDIGQLKDKSFNQSTYDGVKLYAAANGLSYKYYQPANGDQATDDDRYDAMKAAAEGGAKVVVCAGFLQDAALEKAAAEFTDVKFIFIDGWGTGLANIAGIAFKEQECGYFAGYAAVKDGYEKLGFMGGGGGTNPACCRYGYGFVQGANAAAAELGKTVDINYSWQYGSSFSASPELQTMASGWYNNGTEVIFACGGTMFTSIAAAASENDAKVIGVDVDQSYESPAVITSALKGISAATQWAIAKAYDGTWDEIGGVGTSLGAAEDATGLPVDTWSLTGYSVEEYQQQLADVVSGAIVIDDQVIEGDGITAVEFSNVNLHYE
ncbi:MAG: BMP family ABC transporter substrate-binding protein [Oscillospiraceae bacterium]|nr:BMP family ABC transporter substrate-binding protein [Oscillospiraceae bacterium]